MYWGLKALQAAKPTAPVVPYHLHTNERPRHARPASPLANQTRARATDSGYARAAVGETRLKAERPEPGSAAPAAKTSPRLPGGPPQGSARLGSRPGAARPQGRDGSRGTGPSRGPSRAPRGARAARPAGPPPLRGLSGRRDPLPRAAPAPARRPPAAAGPPAAHLGLSGCLAWRVPGPSPARSHRRFPPAPAALRTRKRFRWRRFRFLVTCAGSGRGALPRPPGGAGGAGPGPVSAPPLPHEEMKEVKLQLQPADSSGKERSSEILPRSTRSET